MNTTGNLMKEVHSLIQVTTDAIGIGLNNNLGSFFVYFLDPLTN